MLEFCRDFRKRVFCTSAGNLNASQTFSATVSTVWHASDGEAVEFSAPDNFHERVLKLTKFVDNAHARVDTRELRACSAPVDPWFCQGSGHVWLQKTLEFASLDALRQAKARWRDVGGESSEDDGHI